MGVKIDGKNRKIAMNILYITSDDILRNSSANIRNASLVRGLKDIGHDIKVLCLKPNKHDEHLEKILSDIDILYAINASVNTSNSNTSEQKKTNILKNIAVRLYNLIRVYDPSARLIRKVQTESLAIGTPDIIISSSDPRSSHLLAKKIIKEVNFKGKYVQYWGDPMMNDISASLLVRPFLRNAEKQLLQLPHLIVYTNDATVQQMAKEYNIPRQKMFSIPTPCAKTKEDQSAPNEDKDEVVKIGYFGEYYSSRRNIKPLLDVIANNPKYHLTIAGSTDITVPNTANITQFPHIGASQVAKLQEYTDVLIVLENKPKNKLMANNVIQIPGKVFHYGITDKKILIIEETGLSKSALDKYNRYYFCDNNISDIRVTMEHIAKDNTPSLSTPLQDFFPENVAKILIERIEKI